MVTVTSTVSHCDWHSSSRPCQWQLQSESVVVQVASELRPAPVLVNSLCYASDTASGDEASGGKRRVKLKSRAQQRAEKQKHRKKQRLGQPTRRRGDSESGSEFGSDDEVADSESGHTGSELEETDSGSPVDPDTDEESNHEGSSCTCAIVLTAFKFPWPEPGHERTPSLRHDDIFKVCSYCHRSTSSRTNLNFAPPIFITTRITVWQMRPPVLKLTQSLLGLTVTHHWMILLRDVARRPRARTVTPLQAGFGRPRTQSKKRLGAASLGPSVEDVGLPTSDQSKSRCNGALGYCFASQTQARGSCETP